MNSLLDRIAFWRYIVKEEFTSEHNGSVYPLTQQGFAKFQDDMFDMKAFQYEEMQQRVDREMKEELKRVIEDKMFLERRLQSLKILDERYSFTKS